MECSPRSGMNRMELMTEERWSGRCRSSFLLHSYFTPLLLNSAPSGSLHWSKVRSPSTATCRSSFAARMVNFRCKIDAFSCMIRARSLSVASPRFTFSHTTSNCWLILPRCELRSALALAETNNSSSSPSATPSITSPGNGMVSSQSSMASCFTFLTQTTV